MIRRNTPLGDHPNKWLLISQIEHARVSAALADAWLTTSPGATLPIDLPTEVRQELLSALTHHDDGWASWESNPTLDPVLGQPYSFLDLPREESLPLWRDSITLARRIGPLAGWIVAGHFSRLLHDSDDAATSAARQWFDTFDPLRQQWLAEWQAIDPAHHTLPVAERCLFWLRLFDWLSLWLCCQSPAHPDEVRAHGASNAMLLDEGPLSSQPIRFEPATQQSPGEPRTVQVTPWPFSSVEKKAEINIEINVEVLGYTVPQKVYLTSEALATKRSPIRLRWRLTPG